MGSVFVGKNKVPGSCCPPLLCRSAVEDRLRRGCVHGLRAVPSGVGGTNVQVAGGLVLQRQGLQRRIGPAWRP